MARCGSDALPEFVRGEVFLPEFVRCVSLPELGCSEEERSGVDGSELSEEYKGLDLILTAVAERLSAPLNTVLYTVCLLQLLGTCLTTHCHF